MHGICPKCSKTLSHLRIDGVDGDAGTKRWKCITLCCPYCSVVLGAQIDPIAIKSDIVREITNSPLLKK